MSFFFDDPFGFFDDRYYPVQYRRQYNNPLFSWEPTYFNEPSLAFPSIQIGYIDDNFGYPYRGRYPYSARRNYRGEGDEDQREYRYPPRRYIFHKAPRREQKGPEQEIESAPRKLDVAQSPSNQGQLEINLKPFNKDDLSIQLKKSADGDSYIHIQGSKEDISKESGSYHKYSFSRTFPVSNDVTVDMIRSELVDGKLKLTINKKDSDLSKTNIPIDDKKEQSVADQKTEEKEKSLDSKTEQKTEDGVVEDVNDQMETEETPQPEPKKQERSSPQKPTTSQ